MPPDLGTVGRNGEIHVVGTFYALDCDLPFPRFNVRIPILGLLGVFWGIRLGFLNYLLFFKA